MISKFDRRTPDFSQALYTYRQVVSTVYAQIRCGRCSIDLDMENYTSSRKRIVCFGDSLTEYGHDPTLNGWVNQLSFYFSRRADVINRGFSGYNTALALHLIDEVLTDSDLKPDLLFLWFGANDSATPDAPFHVPLEEYSQNLLSLTRHAQQKGVEVILITPPPCYEPALEEWLRATYNVPLNHHNDITQNYVKATLEVATQTACNVIDVFECMGGLAIERKDYLLDGLHLNLKGNCALFEQIKSTIEMQLPSFNPLNMPWHHPDVPDVDYKTPILNFSRS